MYKLSFIAVFCLLFLPASANADPCPDITVHVDNDVPGSGYTETNGFNWASRPTGACSGTYRYLSHDKQVAPNNDGTRKGKANWKPKITVTGNYEVTISYRATVNRTKDADYIVHDDKGGETHQVIDQAHTGDCTYVKLGTFYCKAGGDCRVELDGTDDGQSDAADVTSFKLVNCDDPPPPGVCAGIAANSAYEVCEQTATSCAGVSADGSGCEAYCAAAGMVCTASFGGEPGCQKEANNPLPCDPPSGNQSDWCDCELAPATGGGGSGGFPMGAGGAAVSSAGGAAGTPDGGASAGGNDGGGAASPGASGKAAGCSVSLEPRAASHLEWLLLVGLLFLRRSRRGKSLKDSPQRAAARRYWRPTSSPAPRLRRSGVVLTSGVSK